MSNNVYAFGLEFRTWIRGQMLVQVQALEIQWRTGKNGSGVGESERGAVVLPRPLRKRNNA